MNPVQPGRCCGSVSNAAHAPLIPVQECASEAEVLARLLELLRSLGLLLLGVLLLALERDLRDGVEHARRVIAEDLTVADAAEDIRHPVLKVADSDPAERPCGGEAV